MTKPLTLVILFCRSYFLVRYNSSLYHLRIFWFLTSSSFLFILHCIRLRQYCSPVSNACNTTVLNWSRACALKFSTTDAANLRALKLSLDYVVLFYKCTRNLTPTRRQGPFPSNSLNYTPCGKNLVEISESTPDWRADSSWTLTNDISVRK